MTMMLAPQRAAQAGPSRSRPEDAPLRAGTPDVRARCPATGRAAGGPRGSGEGCAPRAATRWSGVGWSQALHRRAEVLERALAARRSGLNGCCPCSPASTGSRSRAALLSPEPTCRPLHRGSAWAGVQTALRFVEDLIASTSGDVRHPSARAALRAGRHGAGRGRAERGSSGQQHAKPPRARRPRASASAAALRRRRRRGRRRAGSRTPPRRARYGQLDGLAAVEHRQRVEPVVRGPRDVAAPVAVVAAELLQPRAGRRRQDGLASPHSMRSLARVSRRTEQPRAGTSGLPA